MFQLAWDSIVDVGFDELAHEELHALRNGRHHH